MGAPQATCVSGTTLSLISMDTVIQANIRSIHFSAGERLKNGRRSNRK